MVAVQIGEDKAKIVTVQEAISWMAYLLDLGFTRVRADEFGVVLELNSVHASFEMLA